MSGSCDDLSLSSSLQIAVPLPQALPTLPEQQHVLLCAIRRLSDLVMLPNLLSPSGLCVLDDAISALEAPALEALVPEAPSAMAKSGMPMPICDGLAVTTVVAKDTKDAAMVPVNLGGFRRSVLTRMSLTDEDISAPTLPSLLRRAASARALWAMVGRFRGTNAPRSRETHPLAAASREFRQLATERLTFFTQAEIAKDVRLRWEEFNREIKLKRVAFLDGENRQRSSSQSSARMPQAFAMRIRPY